MLLAIWMRCLPGAMNIHRTSLYRTPHYAGKYILRTYTVFIYISLTDIIQYIYTFSDTECVSLAIWKMCFPGALHINSTWLYRTTHYADNYILRTHTDIVYISLIDLIKLIAPFSDTECVLLAIWSRFCSGDMNTNCISLYRKSRCAGNYILWTHTDTIYISLMDQIWSICPFSDTECVSLASCRMWLTRAVKISSTSLYRMRHYVGNYVLRSCKVTVLLCSFISS